MANRPRQTIDSRGNRVSISESEYRHREARDVLKTDVRNRQRQGGGSATADEYLRLRRINDVISPIPEIGRVPGPDGATIPGPTGVPEIASPEQAAQSSLNAPDPDRLAMAEANLRASRRVGEDDAAYTGRLAAMGFPQEAIQPLLAANPMIERKMTGADRASRLKEIRAEMDSADVAPTELKEEFDQLLAEQVAFHERTESSANEERAALAISREPVISAEDFAQRSPEEQRRRRKVARRLAMKSGGELGNQLSRIEQERGAVSREFNRGLLSEEERDLALEQLEDKEQGVTDTFMFSPSMEDAQQQTLQEKFNENIVSHNGVDYYYPPDGGDPRPLEPQEQTEQPMTAEQLQQEFERRSVTDPATGRRIVFKPDGSIDTQATVMLEELDRGAEEEKQKQELQKKRQDYINKRALDIVANTAEADEEISVKDAAKQAAEEWDAMQEAGRGEEPFDTSRVPIPGSGSRVPAPEGAPPGSIVLDFPVGGIPMVEIPPEVVREFELPMAVIPLILDPSQLTRVPDGAAYMDAEGNIRLN